MKLSFTIHLIAIQLIFLTALNCSDSDLKSTPCTDKQAHLNELRENIRDFAATSVCDDNFECRYIAFGSKPCGGPWDYLIYTTSIDTLKLMDKVKKFNNLEALLIKLREKFSVKWNENVTLYTIRHFDPIEIKALRENKQVLLKQETQETVQLVIKE